MISDFVKIITSHIIGEIFDRKTVVTGSGIIDRIHSQRCNNGSYRKSFIVRYDSSYRDHNGDVIHVNMYQNIEGFNEVARRMRDFTDGDEIMYVGSLLSRETEHYTVHFILIEEPEHIMMVRGEE